MSDPRKLHEVVKDIENVILTEEQLKKVLNILERLETEKTNIFSEMVKKVNSFDDIMAIRQQTDELSLALNLKKSAELETRYIRRLVYVLQITKRRMEILAKEFNVYYNDPFSKEELKESREFLNLIYHLFSLLEESFDFLQVLVSHFNIFITRWIDRENRIMRLLPGGKGLITRGFKERVAQILKMYKDGADQKKAHIGRIQAAIRDIKVKEKKILQMPTRTEDEIRLSLKKITEKVAESAIADGEKTDELFSLGWAVVGDLADNSRLDLSKGFLAGGIAGGILRRGFGFR